MLFNVPITKQMEPSNMKSGKPRKLGRVQKIFIFKGVGGVGGGVALCILWRRIGQPGDGEHSLRWSGENTYVGGDQ